jgi:hypothetical protein
MVIALIFALWRFARRRRPCCFRLIWAIETRPISLIQPLDKSSPKFRIWRATLFPRNECDPRVRSRMRAFGLVGSFNALEMPHADWLRLATPCVAIRSIQRMGCGPQLPHSATCGFAWAKPRLRQMPGKAGAQRSWQTSTTSEFEKCNCWKSNPRSRSGRDSY